MKRPSTFERRRRQVKEAIRPVANTLRPLYALVLIVGGSWAGTAYLTYNAWQHMTIVWVVSYGLAGYGVRLLYLDAVAHVTLGRWIASPEAETMEDARKAAARLPPWKAEAFRRAKQDLDTRGGRAA